MPATAPIASFYTPALYWATPGKSIQVMVRRGAQSVKPQQLQAFGNCWKYLIRFVVE
jgi:hypothetical protein